MMLIYVEEIRNQGRYRATLADGREVVSSSRQPLLDAARVLLAEGVDPETVLIMTRRSTGTEDLKGKLGALAKLAVDESGPRFRRWVDLAAIYRAGDRRI